MDLIAELASISQANHVLSTRIDDLERENHELRLAANLPPTGKITTLVGIEPSRLRELELCERRWETVESIANEFDISRRKGGTYTAWCVEVPSDGKDFAAAVDNASREDTTNAD